MDKTRECSAKSLGSNPESSDGNGYRSCLVTPQGPNITWRVISTCFFLTLTKKKKKKKGAKIHPHAVERNLVFSLFLQTGGRAWYLGGCVETEAQELISLTIGLYFDVQSKFVPIPLF